MHDYAAYRCFTAVRRNIPLGGNFESSQCVYNDAISLVFHKSMCLIDNVEQQTGSEDALIASALLIFFNSARHFTTRFGTTL